MLLLFDLSELALLYTNNDLQKILCQIYKAESVEFSDEQNQGRASENNSGNISLIPRIVPLLGSATDENE